MCLIFTVLRCMHGKFFIQYRLNMVMNMEGNVWLNVRNVEAKLLTRGNRGRWRVVPTEVARELS